MEFIHWLFISRPYPVEVYSPIIHWLFYQSAMLCKYSLLTDHTLENNTFAHSFILLFLKPFFPIYQIILHSCSRTWPVLRYSICTIYDFQCVYKRELTDWLIRLTLFVCFPVNRENHVKAKHLLQHTSKSVLRWFWRANRAWRGLGKEVDRARKPESTGVQSLSGSPMYTGYDFIQSDVHVHHTFSDLLSMWHVRLRGWVFPRSSIIEINS